MWLPLFYLHQDSPKPGHLAMRIKQDDTTKGIVRLYGCRNDDYLSIGEAA